MIPSLERELKPFKRRVQWQSSIHTFWVTAAIGLALTCLLLLVGRVWPLLFQWQYLLIGLLATGVLIFLGQVYAWFKPHSLIDLARLGDATLTLDERLTTAVELDAGALKTSSDIRQAQLDDTLKHLRRAPVSLRVPIFVPKQMAKLLGLVMLLLVAMEVLYLWPNPLEAVVQDQVELEALLETEIEKFNEIQSDIIEQVPDLPEPELAELVENLDDLIAKLEAAKEAGSPEQAMAALSEAAETLETLNENRQAQEQAFNSMADSLADALADSELDAAGEAAEALRNGALDQAAEALQQAGQTPPDSQAQADALANSLEQAAQELADTNPEMAQSLQQAADALRNGDQEALQEALNQAAEQLNQAGQQQGEGQQLSEALENIQQAREALAQQGEGDGDGSGTGEPQSPGQEGQGQGSAQGQLPAQGVGGSGREDPDGDVAEGVTADEGQPGPMSTDNGPNENRLEDYDSVYAPQHVGGEGGPLVAPDPQGSDGSGIDIGETAPNPNRETGETTVPYTEVYGQYRDQASTALDNEHIPLSMRDYIRQYFGALEPGE